MLFLCNGGEQVNEIEDSKAFKYETFAASEGNPKIPKYVRRQVQTRLDIANGKKTMLTLTQICSAKSTSLFCLH